MTTNRAFAFVAVSLVAACSATFVAACSATLVGEGSPVADGGTPNEGTDAAAASARKNPYGVPYPTKNLGFGARSGETPGAVLPDVALVGYRPGADTTGEVALADVFDPEGRTHDLVAVMLCASWNEPSNALMASLGQKSPSRVALLAVLGESGSAGNPATLESLTTWRPKVPATVHNLLDPGWSTLVGLRATSVPYVVLLDARTMEIVNVQAGAPADPAATFESVREAVRARAPSF